MKTLVLVALLAAVAPAFGQGGVPERPAAGAAGRGQRPARSQPLRADAPRGTSVLRGVIVAADNGTPIRRAQVRVASGEARESRVITTDTQGRFEIRELPAGRYTMTVSKAGFVTLQYGQRRPSESGTPIELADGQAIDKLSVALPRGSVLGGRIVDEFGEPVANATVSAWRYAYQGGARRMTPAGQNSRDTTDDQGQYRLFGLPPGEYFVSAMLRGGPEYTDAMGEVSGYAATYYPGTPNVAEAARVTLAVSQENTSVNFGLIATRLVRVSGTVMMSDGAPATNGNVVLVPVNATGRPGIAMQQGGAGNRLDASGSFRIANVAPGRYMVQARAGGRESELARMDLTVGTEDVSGLTLVTGPAATINGTVVSDTGEPFDFRPQQLQLGARVSSPDAMGGPGMPNTRVGDDWSFTIRNISDPVVIRATTPQGWMLKSVSIGGQDVTDTPMEFTSGQAVSGAMVTLTKKVSTLSGLVTDAKGNPVLDATVVIFPSNEKLWTYQSRFIRAARPDQEGRYRVTALPAQDYLVVALQGLEDGQAGDPDFLATVKELASKLEIAEGETKTADVKLSQKDPQR
jgi:hypothetical protein